MEQLSIITGSDLQWYPGSASGLTSDDAEAWAQIANDVVWDAWLNPTDPLPSRIRSLALEVAARASRNPKGLVSWSRSIDDASRTERLPDAAARAGVYLTDGERAELAAVGATVRVRRRVGSITTRTRR